MWGRIIVDGPEQDSIDCDVHSDGIDSYFADEKNNRCGIEFTNGVYIEMDADFMLELAANLTEICANNLSLSIKLSEVLNPQIKFGLDK